MVRRVVAIAATVALAAVLTPAGARAQETQSPAVDDGTEVPFAAVDVADPTNPYAPLTFETEGGTMPPLLPDVLAATATDDAQLALARQQAGLGGFGSGVEGDTVVAAGVPLVGRLAPPVGEGETLTGTTDPSALPPADTGAPPQLRGDGPDVRRSFAFTDDSGEPAPPPEDDEEPADQPSSPTEGVAAEPPPTTTTTAPPSTTSTTPSTTTTAAPTTSTTAPATTTAPTTTTTTRPTTTTTRQTTTSTSTTSSTTTTTTPGFEAATTTTTAPTTTAPTTTAPTTTTTTAPPATTTTVAPPTTTTTTTPPGSTFQLTQERASANACVATDGASASCGALWSVPLSAAGTAHTFDLTIRNSGDVAATALDVWAGDSCASASTGSPAGTGDLCAAVQITIQRYSSAARDVPVECVYGGGTAQVCSLSSARTLRHFSSTYPAPGEARTIGAGLPASDAAYLRVTLLRPELGNAYQRRSATMSITWRMVQ